MLVHSVFLAEKNMSAISFRSSYDNIEVKISLGILATIRSELIDHQSTDGPGHIRSGLCLVNFYKCCTVLHNIDRPQPILYIPALFKKQIVKKFYRGQRCASLPIDQTEHISKAI